MESIVVPTHSKQLAGTEFAKRLILAGYWIASQANLVGARVVSLWFGTLFSAIAYSSVIGAVAIYDITLTIQYADCLSQMELNPVGRWIMGLKEIGSAGVYYWEPPPYVHLFLCLKGAGTLVVLVVINAILYWREAMGHAIASGVSVFQIGLAAFLTLQ